MHHLPLLCSASRGLEYAPSMRVMTPAPVSSELWVVVTGGRTLRLLWCIGQLVRFAPLLLGLREGWKRKETLTRVLRGSRVSGAAGIGCEWRVGGRVGEKQGDESQGKTSTKPKGKVFLMCAEKQSMHLISSSSIHRRCLGCAAGEVS